MLYREKVSFTRHWNPLITRSYRKKKKNSFVSSYATVCISFHCNSSFLFQFRSSSHCCPSYPICSVIKSSFERRTGGMYDGSRSATLDRRGYRNVTAGRHVTIATRIDVLAIWRVSSLQTNPLKPSGTALENRHHSVGCSQKAQPILENLIASYLIR